MTFTPISVKQARLVCSFLPNVTWSSTDGGDIAADPIKYQDTALNIQKTIGGTMSISNRTLKKVHDPSADSAAIKSILAQFESGQSFSMTVQTTRADVKGTALGGLTTYPDCTLLGFKTPNYDRDGSGVATIEIEIAVNAMPTFG